MKSIDRKIKLFGLVLLASFTHSAPADLIAHYVDGNTDYTACPIPNLVSSPPITVSSLNQEGNGETSTNITRNEFGTSNPTPDRLEWLLWRTVRINDTPSSTDDYYSFTLSAAPRKLNLDALSFRMVLAKGSAVGFTVNYEVFVSVDSGSFTSMGTGSMTHSGANHTFTAPVTQNVDLSSITGATTVDIRIAWGDDGASSTGQALFVRDIQVTLPEPSSIGLLGLATGQTHLNSDHLLQVIPVPASHQPVSLSLTRLSLFAG